MPIRILALKIIRISINMLYNKNIIYLIYSAYYILKINMRDDIINKDRVRKDITNI